MRSFRLRGTELGERHRHLHAADTDEGLVVSPAFQQHTLEASSGAHPLANGERFDRNSNSAAHRTLPLGTRALVTNLETGRSEVVEIEDRGPHVRGRIIDVSPRTAERLGMREDGTAQVEVRPIEQPRQR